MNVILIQCLFVILIAMVCLAVRLLSDDLIHLCRRFMFSLALSHHAGFRHDDRSMRQMLRAHGSTKFLDQMRYLVVPEERDEGRSFRAPANRLTHLVTAGGLRPVRVRNGNCTEHGIVYGT